MVDLIEEFGLKRLRIPIAVEYALDEEVEILPVSLIGLNGLFVETTIDFPIGINVVIRFYLPEYDRVVEVVGEVVSKVEEGRSDAIGVEVPGILIQFKAIEKSDRECLKSFLEKNAE